MIRDELRFSGFRDFYKRSRYIKQIYHSLSMDEKWRYKYYIYSNRIISDTGVDLMWRYLNEPENSEDYVSRKKLGEQYLEERI